MGVFLRLAVLYLLLVHGESQAQELSQLGRVWLQHGHILRHPSEEEVELLNDLFPVLDVRSLQLVLEELQVVLVGLDLQVQATSLLPLEGGLQVGALVGSLGLGSGLLQEFLLGQDFLLEVGDHVLVLEEHLGLELLSAVVEAGRLGLGLSALFVGLLARTHYQRSSCCVLRGLPAINAVVISGVPISLGEGSGSCIASAELRQMPAICGRLGLALVAA